jgi:hypothetical protein
MSSRRLLVTIDGKQVEADTVACGGWTPDQYPEPGQEAMRYLRLWHKGKMLAEILMTDEAAKYLQGLLS